MGNVVPIWHVLYKVKFANKTIIAGMASFTLISSWLLLNIILSASFAIPPTDRSNPCHNNSECPNDQMYDRAAICDNSNECPPGMVCGPIYPIGGACVPSIV